MEVLYFPRKNNVGAHWLVKIILFKPNDDKQIQTFNISDWSYDVHVIGKKDTTYDSMKKVFQEKCIISNNYVIINNTNGHGGVKISRSQTNTEQLVMEINYLQPNKVHTGGFFSSSTIMMPAIRMEIISYSDDLRKLFDFVSFMK